MVAEPVVSSDPPTARQLSVTLELPARDNGPTKVRIRVRGDTRVSSLRPRAADILGLPALDAYLTIDGKCVADEEVTIAQLAGPGSRVAVHPRLRGGVNAPVTEEGSRPTCRWH